MVQVPHVYKMVKQFLDITRSHILLHCTHYSPANTCNFSTTLTIFGAFYENSRSWSLVGLWKIKLSFSKENPMFSHLIGITEMFKANWNRSLPIQMLTQQCLFVPRFLSFATSPSFSPEFLFSITAGSYQKKFIQL